MHDEFEFISFLQKKYGRGKHGIIKSIGDDTAVVSPLKNQLLLYTCDSQVEGVHFLPEFSSAFQIGKKAGASAISDIAAMGGRPLHLLVSLHVGSKTSERFIKDIYNGIDSACKKYNVSIVGGNTSKSNELTIDIFVIGEADEKHVLYRHGAKPGDKICVTGTLGDAAAGLFALKNGLKKYTKLIDRQTTPAARISEGQIIVKLKKATSMIDISDGLSNDLLHICRQSSAGARIFLEKLPISEELKSFCKATKKDPYQFALNGGEDYELLFTVEKECADTVIKKVEKQTGTKVTIIGEIAAKRNITLERNSRKTLLKPHGWDHFS